MILFLVMLTLLGGAFAAGYDAGVMREQERQTERDFDYVLSQLRDAKPTEPKEPGR